jgi:hypothetical protein
METERLLDTAIDAFRKIYTEEPWFSWAVAWSSRQDRTAVAAEKVARCIEDLGWLPSNTDHAKSALILRVTALNLTRCAATLASPALCPLSSDETIIAAARAALALAVNAAG